MAQNCNAKTRESLTKGKVDETQCIDGIVKAYSKGRWIPILPKGNNALIADLLRLMHDAPFAGHPGVRKTKAALHQRYYLRNYSRQIEVWIATCDVCQQNKTPNHRPYGQLQSIHLPNNAQTFDRWSMDFITGLPPARMGRNEIVDCILNVVERSSKLALYIPCWEDITAEELAELMSRYIFTKFGFPTEIITDRGTLFVSKFWKALATLWGFKGKTSTSHHPKTDGATEIRNKAAEQYLRIFCNYEQNDWPEKLAFAEMVGNNAEHASTGASPYKVVYGQDMRMPHDVEDNATERGDKQNPDKVTKAESVERAKQRAETIARITKLARMLLKEAQERQTKAYNKTHTPMQYEVGQEVMLSTANLRVTRPSRKYSAKYVGPFKVIEKLGTQAYRLELPPTMGSIHPTIHVARLEPYRKGDKHLEPPPIEVDGKEQYEVEKIVDWRDVKKGPKKGRQYLVKWKGYRDEHNNWEHARDLTNAKDAILEFEDGNKQREPLPIRETLRKQRREGKRKPQNSTYELTGKETKQNIHARSLI